MRLLFCLLTKKMSMMTASFFLLLSMTTTTITSTTNAWMMHTTTTTTRPSFSSTTTTTTTTTASKNKPRSLLWQVALSSSSSSPETQESSSSSSSSSSSTTTTTTASSTVRHVDWTTTTTQGIQKLSYRALKAALEDRQLPTTGTTSQLRQRLRQATVEECLLLTTSATTETTTATAEAMCGPVQDDDDDDNVDADSLKQAGVVSFVDESDPDFEVKELVREIQDKAAAGHWKGATRKLKRLTRRYPNHAALTAELYTAVLNACLANRLHAARAAEPARKILEQLWESKFAIPEQAGNYCIQNSLSGSGPAGTHHGHGGIDTALAMLAVLEESGTTVYLETYDKLVQALAKEGSLDEALAIVRHIVADLSETPPLSTFAHIATAAVEQQQLQQQQQQESSSSSSSNNSTHHSTSAAAAEQVLTLLAYAKAAGYELDSIAATVDGRTILACGVIAAERMGNVALGLRLLTAASKANVAPDQGDTLVACSSSAAQRACTLLHRRAINKAVHDQQWQLAVKLLTLMLRRSLRPSSYIWRNVVTCCAKAEKSRKATALLLDWVSLYEDGRADIPPLTVFNTCINACEICDEEELTLVVLDAMKKTHNTEGNLITFNIALKRLARQGNAQACEGIIIGMLQSGIEPSVVSYTTAIAACTSPDKKNPALAMEWLKRMRSRNVRPNVVTYNTALAACLDGKYESTLLGSKIASEMLEDVNKQLAIEDACEEPTVDEFTNVIPDATTKYEARQLMRQLKENWKEGAIEKRVATDTVRVPLLRLVDFQKSEAAEQARKQAAARKSQQVGTGDEDIDECVIATQQDEAELEFLQVHKRAEV